MRPHRRPIRSAVLALSLGPLGAALPAAFPAGAAAQDEAAADSATAAPAPPPCAAPEFRELDFWVGTWDLTWEGGTGTNIVERRLDDCVIQENFDGGGFRGLSVSTYDPATRQWKQTWVDNAGGYLDFTGGWDDDRMILSRTASTPQGELQQRMVFYDIRKNSLEWDWEVSTDGGREWQLRWRIHYERRPGTASDAPRASDAEAGP